MLLATKNKTVLNATQEKINLKWTKKKSDNQINRKEGKKVFKFDGYLKVFYTVHMHQEEHKNFLEHSGK